MPPHVVAVVAAAVLAISAAGVLVRGADAHPVAIALVRALSVGLLLLPTVRRPSRADALRIALSGMALAAHFVAWFASIHHTTILRSTVLVTLSPMFVGALEWVFFRQRPRMHFWLGVLVAAGGAAMMVTDRGTPTPYGDGLALLGGAFAAVYLVIGRSVRQRVGIGAYASLVCLAAAACLFPVALVVDVTPDAWTTTTWLCLAGLVLGPQLIGHNGMNYALRYVPASTISALTLLEPVGATLLALALLGERPGGQALVGAAITLGGVYVAVAGQRLVSRGGSGGSQPSPSTST